jgi:hypothetical protein
MRRATFTAKLLLPIAGLLAVASVAQEKTPQFVTLEQAQPVMNAFRQELPDELRNRKPADLDAYWPQWVSKRDQEVRARLDQGEEDTITNLLRFGVTYTQQPRIDWPNLFRYGQSVGVDFWVQNRADDLVRALSSPGKNEHMRSARSFLEKKGYSFRTEAERARVKEYLLANLKRMQKEFVGFQEQLNALRAANKLDEAKMLELDSHLFQNRGISLDTNIRPNFAIEQTLKDLSSKGLLAARSVHRVAIVGPGLDFVNKEEGVDFYPTQTIQPFALLDSLLKLKLADAGALEIVTYDISTSVNHHIQRMRTRAAQGLPYELQIPWDATKTWTPEFTAYWENIGLQVGSPGRALPVPDATPELKMRAIKIPVRSVNAIRPVDMNVVFQYNDLSDANRYDLVIGTNIFVYYSAFEQALALRNLSQMIRPGGFLLSNNLLAVYPGCKLREAGRTLSPLSKTETETIFWYRREP